MSYIDIRLIISSKSESQSICNLYRNPDYINLNIKTTKMYPTNSVFILNLSLRPCALSKIS